MTLAANLARRGEVRRYAAIHPATAQALALWLHAVMANTAMGRTHEPYAPDLLRIHHEDVPLAAAQHRPVLNAMLASMHHDDPEAVGPYADYLEEHGVVRPRTTPFRQQLSQQYPHESPFQDDRSSHVLRDLAALVAGHRGTLPAHSRFLQQFSPQHQDFWDHARELRRLWHNEALMTGGDRYSEPVGNALAELPDDAGMSVRRRATQAAMRLGSQDPASNANVRDLLDLHDVLLRHAHRSEHIEPALAEIHAHLGNYLAAANVRGGY